MKSARFRYTPGRAFFFVATHTLSGTQKKKRSRTAQPGPRARPALHTSVFKVCKVYT